jgi:hypothetical protein
MVAIYPNAVKKFSNRVDYTELVEAADVNVAYDEISATQNILGVLPNTDTIDGQLASWPTVSSRITSVRQGKSKPYANVWANNIVVGYNTSVPIQWTSKTWDTHNMWGGGPTLTCTRSGVYTFDIYIRWHADNQPADSQQTPFNRAGGLGIRALPAGGTYEYVDDLRYFPQGWQRSNHQSASITLPWTQGTTIEMIAVQNVLTTGITATAMMAVTYHRDPPTTAFHAGTSPLNNI